MLDPMPRQDAELPPTPREAELLAKVERLRSLINNPYYLDRKLRYMKGQLSFHGEVEDMEREI